MALKHLEPLNEDWSKGMERYKVALKDGKEIDVKVKEGEGLAKVEQLLKEEELEYHQITKKASRPTLTEKKPGPDGYMTGLSDEDEEDKKDQMKKQAAMDDDDPDAYKEMPGDEEAREEGRVKKSKHTRAYHKKFGENMQRLKTIDQFLNENFDFTNEGFTSKLNVIRQKAKDAKDFIKKTLADGEFSMFKGNDKFRIFLTDFYQVATESVTEAYIGPFVFNDKMSDEELKDMYDAALDGYANYSKGFQHPKSKYKQAYQEIEKILKKRGVSVDEGTLYGNEVAIYMGEDGETRIEKRGKGYYGYNNEFDFTAKNKRELEQKLRGWGYYLIAGSLDEAVELVHVYKDGELYGTGELVKGKDKKIKGKKHQLIRFDGSTEDYYPAEDVKLVESINEDYEKHLDRTYGRNRDYSTITVQDLHFQTDAEELEKMKLAYGYRMGGITSREKIEDADYSLRRFRKDIKYGDGKDVGVFLPGSYAAATSKLGDGPHKKAMPKVKWNQRKYDQWIEDVASNDGWKHAYDMAQNAKNEPGLIDWVKRNNRGEDPLQVIQWDIEAMAESVSEGAKLDVSRYKRVWGKEPKGFGQWLFSFDPKGDQDNVFDVGNAMNYSDAKKLALRVADKNGERTVYLMESINEISNKNAEKYSQPLRKLKNPKKIRNIAAGTSKYNDMLVWLSHNAKNLDYHLDGQGQLHVNGEDYEMVRTELNEKKELNYLKTLENFVTERVIRNTKYTKTLTKIFRKEFEDFPFEYYQDGPKIVISAEGYNPDGTLFDMKDDWKEDIIRAVRKHKPKWHTSPNMGGGITIHVDASIDPIDEAKLKLSGPILDWWNDADVQRDLRKIKFKIIGDFGGVMTVSGEEKELDKIKKLFGIDEAKHSVIHKAAKKGNYPVTVIATRDGKVVRQETVDTPTQVPAVFNVVQFEERGQGGDVKVHIESRTGETLFTESVNEKKSWTLVRPGKGYVRKMTVNDYVKDIKHGVKFKTIKSAEQGAEYFNRFHRIDDVVVQAIDEAVNEGKMPDRYVGLDDIVYVKVKEDSRGANYRLYWRGHDVEVGGRRFGSEKELEAFANDYILSNQVYNKLKYKKPQAIPEKEQIDMKKLQTLESFVTEKKKQTNDQSPLGDDGMETGIKNKAKESGVPVGLLRIIMRRGLAAWKTGHRPGATQAQWGYARVNSFLTKQKGTWGGADADIAKKVRDGGHDKKL